MIPRIAFVGDLTADVYKESGTIKFGGAALYGSLWAKKFGGKPLIVSALGSDAVGKKFLSFIRKQGFSTGAIQNKPGPTSTIEIFLKNGERQYGFWVPGVLTDFHLRAIDNERMVEYDAVVFTVYPQYEHILGEVTTKRPLTVINFGDLKEFHDNFSVVERYVNLADILLFGLDKTGDKDLITKIRDLSTATRMSLVTLGKNGSIAWLAGKSYEQPAKQVPLVDTTGAGDAFLAGFLVTYLNSFDIPLSLSAGAKLASKAIRQLGAY